jgi:hypothetical protein
LFGIVEERVFEFFGENNSCGIYRACQTTPPGFIATGFNKDFLKITFEFQGY